MKKLILLTLSVAFVLSSCSTDKNDNGNGNGSELPELALVQSGTPYRLEGGSGTIVVSAPEMVFPTSDSDWCVVGDVVENDNRYTINLTVHENTTLKERTAIITVRSGDERITVTVTQKGMTFTINFGEDGRSINVGHEEEVIRLSYTLDYDVEVSGEFDEPWVDYELEDNNVIAITVSANAETTERSANAKFEAGPVEIEFMIVQAGTEEPGPGPGTNYTMADIVGTYTVVLNNDSQNSETGIQIIETDLSHLGIKNGVVIYNLFINVWGDYIIGQKNAIAGYVDFENDKFYIKDKQLIGLMDLHAFNDQLFKEGTQYQLAFKTIPYAEVNPLEFDILGAGHFEISPLEEEPEYAEGEEGFRWGYVLNGFQWFSMFEETKFLRDPSRSITSQATDSGLDCEMELYPLTEINVQCFYQEFHKRR